MSNYTRYKNTIKGFEPFPSINAAKRESRKLQAQGHNVKVIQHKTKVEKVIAFRRRVS